VKTPDRGKNPNFLILEGTPISAGKNKKIFSIA